MGCLNIMDNTHQGQLCSRYLSARSSRPPYAVAQQTGRVLAKCWHSWGGRCTFSKLGLTKPNHCLMIPSISRPRSRTSRTTIMIVQRSFHVNRNGSRTYVFVISMCRHPLHSRSNQWSEPDHFTRICSSLNLHPYQATQLLGGRIEQRYPLGQVREVSRWMLYVPVVRASQKNRRGSQLAFCEYEETSVEFLGAADRAVGS